MVLQQERTLLTHGIKKGGSCSSEDLVVCRDLVAYKALLGRRERMVSKVLLGQHALTLILSLIKSLAADAGNSLQAAKMLR
jgi:hypothetical protein